MLRGSNRRAAIHIVFFTLRHLPYQAEHTPDDVSNDHLSWLGGDEPVAYMPYTGEQILSTAGSAFGNNAKKEMDSCVCAWARVADLSSLKEAVMG